MLDPRSDLITAVIYTILVVRKSIIGIELGDVSAAQIFGSDRGGIFFVEGLGWRLRPSGGQLRAGDKGGEVRHNRERTLLFFFFMTRGKLIVEKTKVAKDAFLKVVGQQNQLGA